MEESKDCYVEKEKEENIWRRSLQKLSRILRSLGFGLGLKIFANSWRVSVSDLENLVSEKKSRFWFWKICSRKKSRGFGKFGIGKKVSVSVSVKFLVSSFSGPRGASMGSHGTIRLV